MKNILRTLLVSVALVGAGQAMAAGGAKHKKEPVQNCKAADGKMTHATNEKACKGSFNKDGKFDAAPAAGTDSTTAAPAPAATETAPAPTK